MFDIELDKDGDLLITDTGGINLTHSICQAVDIRLKWFFKEWKLNEELGVPYFPLDSSDITPTQPYIFGKNPNKNMIRNILYDQIMAVKGIIRVEKITIDINAQTRKATIKYVVKTTLELLQGEVEIYG